ncbi:hypothetical protein [Desulfosarcina ovata]|uniref:Urocanase Rossmann-like domain-containing protein n=1 Tax=Desulfosarcina ovata subsp. ovata TaxID=2752305 RepID=A0A5K8AD68_9BACT|nr:hypothetical protein [Desulfosarcina ovata]BBO90507.1 hypothetical protein DSCOOX_36870 [Desulfosarcina ovata subsp. ovata]
MDNNEKIDLLSDQTFCHVAYEGGYCPQGLSFAERAEMLRNGKEICKNGKVIQPNVLVCLTQTEGLPGRLNAQPIRLFLQCACVQGNRIWIDFSMAYW